MALENLTPFGTAPKFYEGLLGAEETAALQKRAQVQGLLGAGLALAQGMSRSGAPRSALQNILGAVAGGFQGAGSAYQGGLQNFQIQQQLQQAKMAQEQAIALRNDVEKVMRTPEVANNPSLVALLRADPKKGLEWINENMAVSQAYAPQQVSAPRLDGAEKVLPEVETVAPLDKRGMLNQALDRLEGKTGEGSRKERELILKRLENLDKQEEKERKLTDLTNEDIRVANYLFPDRDPYKPLNAAQSRQLNDELQRLKRERARAGAPSINVGDKSFNTEFGKGVATSVETTFNNAQAAQGTLSTINNIRPLIKAGVYAGPLSSDVRTINQLSSSLGITSGTTDEKLARTAQAMQGLAQLEMNAAAAMKGQGQITENERSLIKRAAAGDLKDFTQKEVLTLLDAMEKTSQSKIRTHEKNLGLLRKRKDTADLADFYALESPTAPAAPAPAATGNRFGKFNPVTGKVEY